MCFSIYLYLELRTRWKSPFPDLLKRIDQRSLLPPPLLPIFSGKRRKTNWAVEPLEFSICPKLTPELSRPARFRLFRISRFSFFAREIRNRNIHAFYPPKKGEGEEKLTLLDSNSPRRKGVNLQFYRWNKFARVLAPFPPRFQRRLVLTLEPSKTTRASLCVLCVRCYIQGKEGCNVVIKLLRKMEIV